ncbi:2OG-Fe(II) oxygenase [Sphingomonas sp. ac-8]|uniref:2OG-Fe(II) oxygenase n=1 Tax=Sphingomonas sp. ac-8 TaxID=3242977 RepID=UPI003A812EAE
MTVGEPFAARIEPLLRSGRTRDAILVAEREAAAGDRDALFQLAVWRLIGEPLPRDLAIAREHLRMARDAGHGGAAHMEVALIANGSGAPADWGQAYTLFENLSRHDAAASAQIELLKAMRVDGLGMPTKLPYPEILSIRPQVSFYRQFLSEAECAHIAKASASFLEPSLVVDPASGRQVPHPIRTSDSTVISPTREDMVIRTINLRIAAVTQTDAAQAEALTILRYRPGQQYRLHLDTLPNTGNQRIRTVLLYLNGGFSGGETQFPEIDLTVAPKGGDAIVFDNVTEDGRPDLRAKHAGLPVRAGAKWVATRWIRARAFDPWRGPELTL